MRFLSVCSGIEAASVAWSSLGWKAVAFAEVESFPSAVLAYHYPDVPNVGDMTKINGADYCGLVDILVGGTPCQSFSVAGLRRGLEDERGNLALEFVRIADESEPAFVVWENVPGVLSDRGNAFGHFLGALAGETSQLEPPGGKWTNAGYVLGPGRAIAWRILDAQYFGLAQRRRRVFLVACPRNGSDPRKVLFEFDGVRRDTPPGRKAGADIAGTLDASFARSRGAGQNPSDIIPAPAGTCGSMVGYVPEIVSPISCKWSKGTSGPAGDEHHNLVVAPPLTGNPYGDHESREGLLVLMNVMAFHGSQDPTVSGDVTHPCGRNGGLETCVVSLTNSGGGDCTHSRKILNVHSRVRRLTPRECERLQGFPDDYTAIVYRGRPASDTPRYRALGNSMAVPVMRWIGERISCVVRKEARNNDYLYPA